MVKNKEPEMNERIRELAEQNGFIHNWQPPGEQNDKLRTLEKFAQLIVQECGKYLESEAERLYALSAQESNPNFQSNFEICAEKCYDNIQGLKEHFGVEE
jgi:hypothetical protein